MELPARFLERMKQTAGAGFAAFVQSYGEPPAKGLRVNVLKIAREEFLRISPFPLTPVPWEENGFYTDAPRAGADPYHFAGLYYLQEPSAMSAAPLLCAEKGERVLDLCAAPGGKCTQLAAAAQGGIVIANEVDFQRAKTLSENVERLGVKNCAVVSAEPAALAARFPCWFDKILVDAPCSGEGMFRKDPNAVTQWSEENVARCCARQSGILDAAADMLRAGGRLVYSTCTFSREENEMQAEAFLKRRPDFRLLKTLRLMPHEVRGEGQFAALFERTDGRTRRIKPFPVRRDGAAERAFSAFCADFFADGKPPVGEITTLSDGRMYLLPPDMPALGVRALRAGWEIGEWDGRVFRPAHALACAVKKTECARYISLSREESLSYLRGEQLPGEGRGWAVAGVEEYPLGLGKLTGGALKNHFPKGLRLRSR